MRPAATLGEIWQHNLLTGIGGMNESDTTAPISTARHGFAAAARSNILPDIVLEIRSRGIVEDQVRPTIRGCGR